MPQAEAFTRAASSFESIAKNGFGIAIIPFGSSAFT
jgi:hypothetical protein